MPATTLTRLPGMALVLSMDGTISGWEKLSASVEAKVFTPTAATSDFIQKVIGQKDGKGSLGYFLGAEAPALAVGDEIEVFSILEGANTTGSILTDAMTFGKCRVTKISEEWQAEPGKGTIDFEFGFID